MARCSQRVDQARLNPEQDPQTLEPSHGLTAAHEPESMPAWFQSFSMRRPSATLAFLVLGVAGSTPARAQSNDATRVPQQVAAPASAQPAPVDSAPAAAPTPGYTPPRTNVYYAPPSSPPPAPEALDARARDAHVDRVLLLPTAETQPAGTTTLTSYEIAVLQVGYAFSDTTQVTLTTTPPIEGIVPLDLSVKSTLARGERYRLAAFGSVSGAAGIENGPAWLGRVGFVGQACFDEHCRSSANLGATAVLLGPATFVATGAGLVLRVSELFAILVEVDSLVPAGRSFADYHGIVGGAGFRWSGRRWAVDAALYSSLDGEGPALPFLAASYRFLR